MRRVVVNSLIGQFSFSTEQVGENEGNKKKEKGKRLRLLSRYYVMR
jgi:hypothetical protein